MDLVLQKIIAASGLASRRKAEKIIKAGRAKINGQTATLGDRADATKDKITVNGHLISAAAKKIYIKLNKPVGYTCTNRRFAGQKNIFDLVKVPARLFAVGRLDKDSHGLVLLTNDGDLTERLAHPRFKHEKIYEVQVKGEIKDGQKVVENLMKGVDIGVGDDGINDGRVRAKRAQYLQNGLFVITLSEGKKRQIRRMFKALNMEVIDLKRAALGNLRLGDLKIGQWEYLKKEEIEKLK